jgi:gliding motility-associated-like protein
LFFLYLFFKIVEKYSIKIQMKKILLVSFCFLSYLFGKAQIDTQFWFVAPDVVSIQQGHADRPVFLRIATLNQASSVTISQPANSNNFTPINVNVAANSVSSVDLTNFIDNVENRPFGQANNRGFLITATNPISIYYEIMGNGSPANNQDFPLNPEIFSLKGRNGLGTDFFVPSQTTFSNAVSEARESIDIVATENNTSITFSLTAEAQGSPTNYQPNQTYTISLNRGQTFALKSTTGNASFSFRGSRIQANKPIAVTISDDSIDRGGSWDLIGDQLFPVEKCGTEYIVIRSLSGGSQDRIYMVATQDNTTITLSGGLGSATINRGQQYEATDISSQGAVYITANKPIYTMHLTGHIGFNNGIESASSILPPLACGGASSVAFNKNTTTDFGLFVVTRDIAKSGFSINGNTTLLQASDFTAVPNTGGVWVYALKTFDNTTLPANQSHSVTNSISTFHLGTLSAYRNSGNNIVGSNYAYFSNIGTLQVNIGGNQSICQGQSVTLDAGANFDTYSWTKDGVTFGGNTRTININTAGTYAVNVTQGTCTASAQMTLSVNPIPTPTITNTVTTFCTSDPAFTLTGSPAGGTFTINGITTNTFNPNMLGAGSYNVIYSLTQNGCTGTTNKNFIVNNCAVSQFFIPELFSPNNDGKNDNFIIGGIDDITDFELKLFNRFGTLVYETKNIQEASTTGWNGKLNGVEQPAGVYMWQIKGKNSEGIELKFKNKNTGNVYLTR